MTNKEIDTSREYKELILRLMEVKGIPRLEDTAYEIFRTLFDINMAHCLSSRLLIRKRGCLVFNGPQAFTFECNLRTIAERPVGLSCAWASYEFSVTRRGEGRSAIYTIVLTNTKTDTGEKHPEDDRGPREIYTRFLTTAQAERVDAFIAEIKSA